MAQQSHILHLKTMSNITPVNTHILIEPVKHEQFMALQSETYNEIGVVVKIPSDMPSYLVTTGDKVYFDSWLAAKYPKEGGEPDEFCWLVKWEDVRAVEYAQPKVSEQ